MSLDEDRMSSGRRYSFSSDVRQQLEAFKAAIDTQGLNSNTLRQRINYAGIFLTWLSANDLDKVGITHQEIIRFIRELQSENYSVQFINRVILAVRHYYDYLGVQKNPAVGIYLKGMRKMVIKGLVEHDELLRLYDQYQVLDDRSRRNKIMLGLMICQALSAGDFNTLEPHHIKLHEGKVYIPASGALNARVLDLQATQLLDLQEYLNTIRPRMLEGINKPRGRRKVTHIQWDIVRRQLFFSVAGNHELKYTLFNLFKTIKKLNPKVTSCHVIRHSVVTEWLKSNGLRQVQYMAGYRWVGTVERYKNYHLDELKEALRECHPLQ